MDFVFRLPLSLASAFLIFFSLSSLPARSASSLAAWALEPNGVLHLRTSVGTSLKAFFKPSSDGKGSRVWIDFQGELIRPRRIAGNGLIREIRLGKPYPGVTRLVIELKPSIYLNPSKMKLVGISSDRWKLHLVGLPLKGFRRIAEGDLTSRKSKSRQQGIPVMPLPASLSASTLPYIPQGRFRIVIDPGHGGPDPGAIGRGGVRETDLVLDVSLKVAQLLKAKGIKIILTRISEIDLDLPPRVAIANRSKADAFVSIHANASRNPRKDVNGIETFYFSGSEAFRLSKNIQKQVLRVSPGSPDRGVRKGRFFVIRRTSMPAALVEIGFVTGRFDSSKLSSPSHRNKIAWAISKGIIDYLKGES